MVDVPAVAAVLREFGGQLELTEVCLAEPADHEVVIRVKASSICRSDLTVSEPGHGFALPLLLGHEVAGVVERVGNRVTTVQAGDHVIATPVSACSRCRNCRVGQPFRCMDRGATQRGSNDRPRVTMDDSAVTQFLGIGGFATHALLHENALVRVPRELPFDVACLLGCGVATGLGAALHSARLTHGDTAVVIGCGGVGLNIVQGARLAGAQRIVAVDPNPQARDLARRLGATEVLDPAAVDVGDAVRALTGGQGATHAFEAIGRAVTVQQGLESLAKGGTLYLVGVQPPRELLEIEFRHFFEQKGVRGIAMGSTIPHVHLPDYADLYLQGRLQLDPLVATHIKLEDINQGLNHLREGQAARAVVMFD